MPILEFAAGSAIAFVAASLQGSIGIGFSLIAGPLLLLLNPDFVPAPVLCGLLLLAILMTRREHASRDRRGLRWALIGRVPGTIAGIGVLLILPTSALNVTIGALVLLGVAMSAGTLKLAPHPRTLFAAGVISGIMETTSSIGGPPVALAYRAAPGPVVRATISAFFIVGAIMSLAALATAGHFSAHQVDLGLSLLPGVIAGFALSSHITPHVDRRGVGSAVLIVSALAGALVIIRQIA